MKPVLQIVHVSDMHVVARHFSAPSIIRRLARAARAAGVTKLFEKLRDGTAQHDPFAPIYFQRFIREVSAKDPIWSRYPTWIVDTGDQTTFGDTGSIKQAQAELAAFVAAAGPGAARLVDLHGNHDAWPENVPLFAPQRILGHTSAISSTYRCGAARLALSGALPSGGNIELYAIDSVNDHFWENTWARGHVAAQQLADLCALVKQRPPGSAPTLRILAVHHPLHHPPPQPLYEMVLANASDVATAASPIHLVLSGHTHDMFPANGALPSAPAACHHQPLGGHQVQLVAGTLSQVDRLGNRAYAHQAVLLRLYQDPAKPDRVIVERFLIARGRPSTKGRPNPGGIGDYRIVPASAQDPAEEMELRL